MRRVVECMEIDPKDRFDKKNSKNHKRLKKKDEGQPANQQIINSISGKPRLNK